MRAKYAAIIRLAILDAKEDFVTEDVHRSQRHRKLKTYEDGNLYLRAYSHAFGKLTMQEIKDMLSRS